MISKEFAAQVQALRDEGLNWAQISRRVGRPKRTCQRAISGSQRVCARRDCRQRALASGRFCEHHARLAMANKPGGGEQQRQVMRMVRKRGMLTFEELRNSTGLGPDNLSHTLKRLLDLGLLERPIRGHYRLPRKATVNHD